MQKYFIITLILIFLDQMVKFIVTKYFQFSKNYGAIFGILQNRLTLIILLSFFAIGFLLYYTKKVKSYDVYGLSLVLAGIISNLIDRLVYGYVIDYIKILTWPSFNLADIFLVSGVIFLIFYLRRSNF